MHQSPMWDDRYSTDDYLFGREPADFLLTHDDLLPPGASALVVADGEGRNSVHLAAKGLAVTATDLSPVGRRKALRLAAERGVELDARIADITEWPWNARRYDLVVAVFIQFLQPTDRQAVFDGFVEALEPGGRLLLHGYRPEQIANGTGGPPDPALLYTEELLRHAFGALEIEELRSYDAVLAEGTGHVGLSALIDLVARKPGE